MEDFENETAPELANDDAPEDIPEDIPEEDAIDLALIELVEELLGEEADEDSFDETADEVFALIGELVDRGEVKEIPDNGTSEQEQKEWIDASIPMIREAIKQSLHDQLVPDSEKVSEE